MLKKITFLLLVLGIITPSLSVFAQGNFDYLTVKGPGITGEINITNPALTGDFFAFADFTKDEVPPPVDPGEGYQIVRVHIVSEDDKPEPVPFDQLHYYPYTGYVFYDGLASGSSEYDGKWYTANPSADKPFRDALAERARLNWIPLAGLVVLLAVFLVAYYRKPNKTVDD